MLSAPPPPVPPREEPETSGECRSSSSHPSPVSSFHPTVFFFLGETLAPPPVARNETAFFGLFLGLCLLWAFKFVIELKTTPVGVDPVPATDSRGTFLAVEEASPQGLTGSRGDRVPASLFVPAPPRNDPESDNAKKAPELATSIVSTNRSNPRTKVASPASQAALTAFPTFDLASNMALITLDCTFIPSFIPCSLATANAVESSCSRS